MSWELPLLVLPMVAGESLTADQFTFVKVSADNTVVGCGTLGERALGILQNDPASGAEAAVMVAGVSKLVAGEALVAGDLVGTSTTGRGVKIEETATGADVGSWALALCLQAAAADAYVATVLLLTGGYRVTA